MLLSAALLWGNVGSAVTLAADLSDTSAESSVSALLEQEGETSADNSAVSIEEEDGTDLPAADGSASGQGTEAEVSASLESS